MRLYGKKMCSWIHILWALFCSQNFPKFVHKIFFKTCYTFAEKYSLIMYSHKLCKIQICKLIFAGNFIKNTILLNKFWKYIFCAQINLANKMFQKIFSPKGIHFTDNLAKKLLSTTLRNKFIVEKNFSPKILFHKYVHIY